MDDVRYNNDYAPCAGTIVCFGTSNTYGYAPDRFPDCQYPEGCAWPEIIGAETDWLVLNHGICGREIPCTKRQIQRIREFARTWAGERPAPVLLWIELGTNDLLKHDHFRAEDAAARMEVFLRGLQEEPCVRDGTVRMRLISPPRPRVGEWIPDPLRAAEFGRLGIVYRDLARDLGVDYTDTTPWDLPLACDGVHLTEEGHRIFAHKAMQEILST